MLESGVALDVSMGKIKIQQLLERIAAERLTIPGNACILLRASKGNLFLIAPPGFQERQEVPRVSHS